MRTSIVTAGLASLMLATPVPSQAAVTDADRAFLTGDVQGARYELALAKVAAAQATIPKIKRYAQSLVHDHTITNAALVQLSRQEGVDVPSGMTSEDSQRLSKLSSITGSAFNQYFLDEESRINDADEHNSDKELASTNEPAIKTFINRFATMDQRHKHMADQLKGDY